MVITIVGCSFLLLLIVSAYRVGSDDSSTSFFEKIPRIIHYIWIGPLPKTDLVKKNIRTWKKYCPGWLLVEWNDDTIEELNNTFAEQAFGVGKYAFTADYLRVYVVNKFGGVYLDSDVELRQSLDGFLKDEFFIGREPHPDGILGPHLFGSTKHNPILEGVLKQFSSIQFIQSDGHFDETILPERFDRVVVDLFNVSLLEKRFEPVRLNESTVIYPDSYFWSSWDNKNGYALHHISRTWRTENYKKATALRNCMNACRSPLRQLNNKSTSPFLIPSLVVLLQILLLSRQKCCCIFKPCRRAFQQSPAIPTSTINLK